MSSPPGTIKTWLPGLCGSQQSVYTHSLNLPVFSVALTLPVAWGTSVLFSTKNKSPVFYWDGGGQVSGYLMFRRGFEVIVPS